MTETIREYADVVFPAEAYPEKEGTLTHPDGRLQRLRTAIGRPQPSGPGTGVRPRLAGHRRRRRRAPATSSAIAAGPIASRRLFEAVPFYAGLTLDEIGGRGVRWQEREAASSFEVAGVGAGRRSKAPRAAPRAARARCGSAPTARCGARRRSTSRRRCTSCARSRWSSCRPPTPSALGIADGDRVEVGSNGTRVRGAVRLRDAIPRGSVFLAEGRGGRRQRADRGGWWRSLASAGRTDGRDATAPRRARGGRRRDAAVRAAGDPAHRLEPVGARRMTLADGRLLRGRGGSSCSRRS